MGFGGAAGAGVDGLGVCCTAGVADVAGFGAVDGGVTPQNARQVCQAGAQVLVAGRGVFQGATIAENIAGLRVQGLAGEAEYSHARN